MKQSFKNIKSCWRKLIIYVFLTSLVFLSGCSPGQDTNELIYIIMVGFDNSDNGKLLVTFQFEKNEGDNKTQGETGGRGALGGSGGQCVTIEATTMAEATKLLTSIVSKDPSFDHVRGLVFGEEYARNGVWNVLVGLLRQQYFRNNAYILVVNNSTAEEFISENKSGFETSLSKYIGDKMLLSDRSNYFVKTNLEDFYNNLKSNSIDPLASLVAINPQKGRIAEPDIDGHSDEEDAGYYAGEVPRRHNLNPSEILGTAVFRKDKLVGKLDNKDTQMINILTGKFISTAFFVEDPNNAGQKVGVILRLNKNPNYNVKIVDGKVKIDINAEFYGEISSIESGIHYEYGEYRKELEEKVAESLRNQLKAMLDKTQEFGTDIIGFGYKARTSFKTYPEYMRVDWREMYKNAEINIDVVFKVDSGQLMWRMSPLR